MKTLLFLILLLLNCVFFSVLQPAAFAQNWIRVSSVDSTEILALTRHNDFLVAIADSAVFRGQASGEEWVKIPELPATMRGLSSVLSHKDFLYIGNVDSKIFRSSDNGDTWQEFSTGIPSSAQQIFSLTALGDSLYAGTGNNGIYLRSLSSVSTWQTYNSGLFQLGVNHITTSGDYLIASVGFYLFRRHRHGTSWEQVPLDNSGLQYITYETMAAGSYLYAGTENGIYRGDLNGDNFQVTDLSFFNSRDVNAFAVWGETIFANLFIINQFYTLYSENQGQKWDVKFHEFVFLNDMLVADDKIWGARTDGLWRVDLGNPTGNEPPEHELPSEFKLLQNYPNPFNPSTTIRFSIPSAMHVSLKIFDITGREVIQLVNEPLISGVYSVLFDAGELPTGIYLYTLQTEQFNATGKALLIK